MSRIDPKLLDLAFVAHDAPRFDDVLRRIQDNGEISGTRRRDLASGLRRVAKALGRRIEAVPADVDWLRPRIAAVAPAAIGLTEKSWTNAVSDARAALAHCGMVQRRQRRLHDLGHDWRPLWQKVIASRDQSLATALGRFVHFLDRVSVAPTDVSDAHVVAYREAVAINEIRKSPEIAARAAVYGWNLAVRRIGAWPQRLLSNPSRGNRYALPLSDFPESFAADLACFVAGMARPDPLDTDALTRPLRPATINHRRAQIIRFASRLVADGVPIARITDLAAIVDPPMAERGLRAMLARAGGKTTPGIAEIAVMLKMVAMRHAKLREDQQAQIRAMAKRLTVPAAQGMTGKNRARLRPFADPETLRELATLPERLMVSGEASKTAALLREMAVAIAILLVCPIRRRNLATLHLERNIHRPRDGRAFLVFAAHEAKNRRDIEFELPADVTAMIDRHVATRSPALCPPGTPWLFPRRDGDAPIDPSHLSNKITRAIRRDLGLDVNPHLFRHLAAKIWLDANPGQYEAARRLLGHAALSSTLNAYAGFEAGTATRLFADLVDSARQHQSLKR